jgi:hypothetical protein
MLALIKKVFTKPAAKKSVDTLYVQWRENNLAHPHKVITVSFHATVNGPHVYSFTCKTIAVMQMGFGRMAGLQGMSTIKKLVPYIPNSGVFFCQDAPTSCYNWMRIRGFK